MKWISLYSKKSDVALSAKMIKTLPSDDLYDLRIIWENGSVILGQISEEDARRIILALLSCYPDALKWAHDDCGTEGGGDASG